MEEWRALFIKSYSNVPNDLRGDIIVVVDEKPYSWDAAYYEVKNNTDFGKKVLKKLNEIGLLK
jgi:hypothetical protein